MESYRGSYAKKGALKGVLLNEPDLDVQTQTDIQMVQGYDTNILIFHMKFMLLYSFFF